MKMNSNKKNKMQLKQLYGVLCAVFVAIQLPMQAESNKVGFSRRYSTLFGLGVSALAGALMFKKGGISIASGNNRYWFNCVRGSGILSEEVRDIKGIKSIKADGAFNMIIKEANDNDQEKVIVSGDDNLLPLIITKQNGDTLSISLAENVVSKNLLECSMIVTALKQLTVDGAIRVDMHVGKEKELSLDIAGTSSVVGKNINAQQLNVGMSGSSSLNLKGAADKQTISLSGASTYDARNLKSKSADFEVNGTSRLAVNVTERLQGSASGASRVTYLGRPRQLQVQNSGASKIRPG